MDDYGIIRIFALVTTNKRPNGATTKDKKNNHQNRPHDFQNTILVLNKFKKMDDNIYYAVNKYLAEWDPIGLPIEIANVEYVDYVPEIVESMTDRQKMIVCLIDFLGKIGTSKKYIRNSVEEEIFMRADDLLNLMKISRSHDVYLRIIDKVPFIGNHTCYIIYDDVRKCVCWKVEAIKSEELLSGTNCQVSNSIKKGSHLTIKSIVERFYTEFISKEEFESETDHGVSSGDHTNQL